MKKTFKTFTLMLLAALAFSSCADVPAPYNLPTKNGGSSSESSTIEPAGEGTLASPYNVAAIVAKIKEMEAGVESVQEYYIKGKVSNIKTDASTITQYGNHTFEMIDEGNSSTVFTAFQVYGPGKQKFTSLNDIKVGDEVVVCGRVVNYKGNTPETVGKGAAYVVSINAAGGGGGDSQGGSGEGTEITCAQAVQLTNALADGTTSTETYTITGYITEVIGTVSRNQQSFWMADTKDGGQSFQAYWANLPSGVTEFKAGMKVKITGQLMKFMKSGAVVPEMKNANVTILEDGGSQGGGGDVTPVEGTEVTCAQAVQLTNALADGGTSTETYSITGYITEILGTVSRNQQSFWMADTKDGGKVFEAYWANLPEGVAEFKVGMKVKITGQLMKYVKNGEVTPEIKNANVVILENGDGGDSGGGDGGDDNPGGDTVTDLVNGGFEEWVSDTEPKGWKSVSSASNATVKKSTEARNGSFSCSVAPSFDTKDPSKSINARLATQEITLAAGSYTFSYYAKSTTADACQSRGGYVPVNHDNSVGAYKYNTNYTNLSNTEWTLVTYDFELTEQTTVCLIVMNPKGSSYSISQDILVDDATLVKK